MPSGCNQHGGGPQVHGGQGLAPKTGAANDVDGAFLGHVDNQVGIAAHPDRRYLDECAVFGPAVELVVKSLQAAHRLVNDLLTKRPLNRGDGVAVQLRPVDDRRMLVHEGDAEIVRRNGA